MGRESQKNQAFGRVQKQPSKKTANRSGFSLSWLPKAGHSSRPAAAMPGNASCSSPSADEHWEGCAATTAALGAFSLAQPAPTRSEVHACLPLIPEWLCISSKNADGTWKSLCSKCHNAQMAVSPAASHSKENHKSHILLPHELRASQARPAW